MSFHSEAGLRNDWQTPARRCVCGYQARETSITVPYGGFLPIRPAASLGGDGVAASNAGCSQCRPASANGNLSSWAPESLSERAWLEMRDLMHPLVLPAFIAPIVLVISKQQPCPWRPPIDTRRIR